MDPLIKTQGEGSSVQTSPKHPITYKRRHVTRSTSSKGKDIPQDALQDLQEAEAVLQETLLNLQETQKLDKEGSMQEETKREDPELREPSPQPNLDSYYRFIEGLMVIPQKISSHYSLSLRKKEQEHIDG